MEFYGAFTQKLLLLKNKNNIGGKKTFVGDFRRSGAYFQLHIFNFLQYLWVHRAEKGLKQLKAAVKY